MDFKAGQMVKVTISKAVKRAAARKTLERLFMKDGHITAPLLARSANHAPRPKRRGGRIWTKYPTKLHTGLGLGEHATLLITAQVVKDLNSVEDLIQIAAA